MSQNQSKNVQVILTVSREFYKILKLAAGARGKIIEEYVLDELICGMDGDLQDPDSDEMGLWKAAGFATSDFDYQDRLKAMAIGEEARP